MARNIKMSFQLSEKRMLMYRSGVPRSGVRRRGDDELHMERSMKSGGAIAEKA